MSTSEQVITGCAVATLAVILYLVNEWNQSQDQDKGENLDCSDSESCESDKMPKKIKDEELAEVNKTDQMSTADSSDGMFTNAKNYIKSLMPFGG